MSRKKNLAATLRAAADIAEAGVRRVLVNIDGDAKNAKDAESRYGVTPAQIFVRDDGWSLGAPSGMIAAAYRTWEGRWVGVIVGNPSKGESVFVMDIETWLEKKFYWTAD